MNNDTLPGAPTEAHLRDAAIAHLARYPSTRISLTRVLLRRIEKWAARARRSADREEVNAQVAAARAAIDPIVEKLIKVGAVDDAAFAANRSRSMTRSGKSSRAVQANLAAKGVAPAVVKQALPPDPAREFGAALVAAKKRKLGPFSAKPGEEARKKELATLARAGFGERIARDLFKLTRDEAEERLREWRGSE